MDKAFVGKDVQIGKGVIIEPFAVVKGNTILKDNVIIKSHAYIDGNTLIGKNSVIWPGASIGTKPQDLKYEGEKTFVEIGENVEIREYATINTSCGEGSKVVVQDNCLIMAYCHVAHNCFLGKNVIMSNGAMLAGHVEIGDFGIIGGMTPVHQFVRIGRHAMVGGFSRITHDIPPYSIGGGDPFKYGGINLVGLKRRGFSLHTRNILSQVFKIFFRSGLTIKEAKEKLQKEVPMTDEVRHWMEFFSSSKRGVMGKNGFEE